MKSENIPADIKSKSLKEAKEEINEILAKLESENLDLNSIEVEYKRLLNNGVEFHAPPQDFGQVKATYGRDCDGNVFEIQEIIDPEHPARVFND